MGSRISGQAQGWGLLAWEWKELDSRPAGCIALTTFHLRASVSSSAKWRGDIRSFCRFAENPGHRLVCLGCNGKHSSSYRPDILQEMASKPRHQEWQSVENAGRNVQKVGAEAEREAER